MISFEEALNKVLESAHTIGTEIVEFENSLNRVLAEDIVSDIDMPPFNKSAMDGYACRREDLKMSWKLSKSFLPDIGRKRKSVKTNAQKS